MKCVDNLKRLASKVGATVDDSSDYALILDAPSGYEWASCGITCLCEQSANNSQTWYATAVKNLIERASMGLTKVTDQKTINEYRHFKDDDTWGATVDSPQKIEWPKGLTD